MSSRMMLVLLLAWGGAGVLPAASEEADNRGMFVTTSFTDLGKSLAAVTPQDPVRYQVITRGFIELGESLDADNGPDREEFLRLVLQAAARQSYLPADEENPADIVLGITWGSLRGRPESCGIYVCQGALPLLWAPAHPLTVEWDRLLERFDVEGRTKVLNLVRHDVYVLVIAAYDWRSAYRGQQVLLWQTRVAFPARGFSATDALTRALQAARPLLGRAQTAPHWAGLADVERAYQEFRQHNPTVELPLDLARLVVHDYGSRR